MDYSTDTTLLEEEFLIFLAILVIGFFVIFALIFNVIIPFKEERNYIKMEMERSYEEEEYLYWKRELRRLYISHIPIIGRFFR